MAGKPKLKFPLCRLNGVACVNGVGRHLPFAEVIPDVSGICFRGVGGAVQFADTFDGVVADDNDSEDVTREHEVDSAQVEGFADMVSVVFFDEVAVGSYCLMRTDSKT